MVELSNGDQGDRGNMWKMSLEMKIVGQTMVRRVWMDTFEVFNGKQKNKKKHLKYVVKLVNIGT